MQKLRATTGLAPAAGARLCVAESSIPVGFGRELAAIPALPFGLGIARAGGNPEPKWAPGKVLRT